MQQTQTIEGFRPSPQQTRLWLFQQHSHAYQAWGSVFIEGQLEIAPFQQALQTALARHEIYRTCLHHVPGLALPVQVINPTPLSRWLYIDLKSCAPQEQQRLLKKLTQAEKRLVIDVEQGPLVSHTIFALSEHQHLWSIHLSALHCDPQTLQNLIGEIVHCYASPTEPPNDVIQYLQFSEWQNALLEEEREDEKASWSEKDLLAFSTVSLPFKAKTKEQNPFDPEILMMPLCLDTRLEALLEKLQCTLAEFLLTCWYILLWKLAGHDEILVSLTTDGRTEDLQDIAGLLAKCLPLVCTLKSQQRVRKLLRQIQDACEKLLLDHLYFNWEQLEGIAGPASFFAPFVFEWREQPDPLVARSASFTLQQWESYFEPFHVKLVALHGSQGLTIQFHFDRNLFDIQQIQRLAEQFALLVEQIIRQPEQRIGRLDILSATEREQLLVQFHQHSADFPRDLCLHQMFEQQVARTPDAIAVEYEQEQLTYHHLNRRAHQLAHYLQHLGVGLEMPVGIGLGQSIELVIGVLGILKAGGAYVPLDTTHPRERLVSLLEGAHISILLTDSHHQEFLPTTQQVICLDTDWTSIAQSKGEEDPLLCTPVPTNLAYVIYTSGSTGQPKGVMIPHQGVVHYVDWSSKHYAVATGIGSPVHSPLAFDLTVTSFFPPLMVGRRLVLVPDAPGIEGLRQTLSTKKTFSLLKITPAHLNLLNQSLQPEEFANAAHALIIGGEALHSESLSVWRQYAPRTRLINEYGPTETVVGCCIYEVGQDEEPVGVVPIGRPIPNTQIYLLDAHLQLVPLGAPGELYVGGVGLGRGYLNRPNLTAERFLPNPFSKEPGARLYKTGDVARYISADGTLEYLGRIDNQIKLRGYRIELGEIEAVLRQHPHVRDCIVMMREDGEPQLVGYLVPGKLLVPADMNVGDFLRERLPEYMVPSRFVYLKFFPLTANGKVNRQQLAAATKEDNDALLALVELDDQTRTIIQPRDAIEWRLLQIWEDLLQRRPLSICDDFFKVGGHSLLAVRLMSHITKHFGQTLDLATLFQHSTVAELAAILHRQTQSEELSPLVAIQAQGSRPPFFCVHPVGGMVFCYVNLARRLGPDQPFYGFQTPHQWSDKQVLTTIEEIAASYLALIRTVQPQGPYLLGGWSSGGVVAFEMAQQLQRQGDEVGLLAIIDSQLPSAQLRTKAMQEETDLGDAGVVKELIRRSKITIPDDFDQRELDAQLSYTVEQAKKMSALPIDASLEFIRHFLRIRMINKHVAYVYVPQSYPHQIDYFAASDSLEQNADLDEEEVSVEVSTRLQRWREVAQGGMQLHVIPGDHPNMVEEPNVQVLADTLRSCIDRVCDRLAHGKK